MLSWIGSASLIVVASASANIEHDEWPNVCVMVPTNKEILMPHVLDQLADQEYPKVPRRTVVILTDQQDEHGTNVAKYQPPWMNSAAAARLREEHWDIQWKAMPLGTTLGAKRNEGVRLCKREGFKESDVVIQWDDDDLSFPGRLHAMAEPLRMGQAAQMSVMAQGLWHHAPSHRTYEAVGPWTPHFGTLSFRLGLWDDKAGVAYNEVVSCAEETVFVDEVVVKHGRPALAVIQNSSNLWVYTRHQSNSHGCFNDSRLSNSSEFRQVPLPSPIQARLQELSALLSNVTVKSNVYQADFSVDAPFTPRFPRRLIGTCDLYCVYSNGQCVSMPTCVHMYMHEPDAIYNKYCGSGCQRCARKDQCLERPKGYIEPYQWVLIVLGVLCVGCCICAFFRNATSSSGAGSAPPQRWSLPSPEPAAPPKQKPAPQQKPTPQRWSFPEAPANNKQPLLKGEEWNER